jgi:hypothetical protein
MTLPSIDAHRLVAPLLTRESEIQSELYALRQPAPAGPTASEGLVDAARRFLAGGDARVTTAAEVEAARQGRVKLLEVALRELRAQMTEARSTARRELIAVHNLAERSAEHRHRVFDLTRQLHAALAEASELAVDLHLAELWQGSELWPGQSDGLRLALAAHLLKLADAGATLHPSEIAKMEVATGRRSEPPLTARTKPKTAMQKLAEALS